MHNLKTFPVTMGYYGNSISWEKARDEDDNSDTIITKSTTHYNSPPLVLRKLPMSYEERIQCTSLHNSIYNHRRNQQLKSTFQTCKTKNLLSLLNVIPILSNFKCNVLARLSTCRKKN